MTADAIPTLALSQATISPEVQGALTSVLRSSLDPRTRSSVICAVILEMCSIVEGLTISEPGHTRVAEAEMASVRQLAGAAYDHRLRMTFLARTAGSGAR
ncbi:MAG TPA: hypothetical protein VIT65_13105 [Microlunatus sp.]